MEKKNCSCEAEKEERRVKRGKMKKKKKALVFVNEEKLEISERSKGTKEEPRKYETNHQGRMLWRYNVQNYVICVSIDAIYKIKGGLCGKGKHEKEQRSTK